MALGDVRYGRELRLEGTREVLLHSDENPLGKPLCAWSKQEVGRYGEDLATMYLQEQGLEIMERNWRCSLGEVDIVADDNGQIVLVEVKTRVDSQGSSDILPEEAVGYRKRNRYKKLALVYLSKQIRCDDVRFDVASVKLRSEQDYELRYMPAAYGGEW